MVPQVGKNPIHSIDNIIGIQISVLRLCPADNVYGFIRRPLQLRVRMTDQGISHCLNPLGKITVLKHETIEPIRIRIPGVFRQRFKAPKGI